MEIILKFYKNDNSFLRLEDFYLKVQMSTGKNVGRKRGRQAGEGKHRMGYYYPTGQALHKPVWIS